MGQILIRNLDPDIKQRLQRRAARHGRSMAAEIREILNEAADLAVDSPPGPGLGARIAQRFAGLGLTEDIPALRGEAARPAEFRTP